MTAARPCCRTSRSSPVARSSPRRSASSSRTPASTCSAGPARSSSPRTRPRSSRVPATPSRSPAGSTRSAPRSRSRDSDYDREKLQERLAKLAGGVAVIKVGAATEVELKERKHRIEDAVRNAKAAVEEGIVAGGGVALIQAGARGVRQARARRVTRRPARTSSGSRSRPRSSRSRSTPASRAASWRRRSRDLEPGWGLNAATGEYVDMIKAGHHRPGQGHPLGAAERGVDRGAVPHHRGRHRRQAGEGVAPARRRLPAAWATWTSESSLHQARPPRGGPGTVRARPSHVTPAADPR